MRSGIAVLAGFVCALSNINLSSKYLFFYLQLYVELQGTKGRINYQRLAILWGIKEPSVWVILKKLEEKGLIRRDREEVKIIGENKYFYLFITPLLHPKM
jgi:hypothetical protein